MNDREVMDLMSSWVAYYPQLQLSDRALDDLIEDFAEFDPAIVNAVFKQVRREYEHMPTLTEFRNKVKAAHREDVKSLKNIVETQIRNTPQLRYYLIKEFEVWSNTLPKNKKALLQKRIENASPRLLAIEKDWRKVETCVIEAGVILKEAIADGEYRFDDAAFFAYQSEQQQKNAENRGRLEKMLENAGMRDMNGNVIPFPKKIPSPNEEAKIMMERAKRRESDARKKYEEQSQEEHLHAIIQQRDELLKAS